MVIRYFRMFARKPLPSSRRRIQPEIKDGKICVPLPTVLAKMNGKLDDLGSLVNIVKPLLLLNAVGWVSLLMLSLYCLLEDVEFFRKDVNVRKLQDNKSED